MKIVIDARESGTGTGRYIDKLVEHLHALEPPHEFVVLTKTARMEFMQGIAPSFKILESNYKEFTFAEQIGYLRQLNELKPGLVHFGMTQQPFLYRGKVVTTIHDLTTARFTNPVKNLVVFKIKQGIYKMVIKKVARKSSRIIVPSQYVKRDVAQFAKVPISKINVTYEAADKIDDGPEPIGNLKTHKFIMYVGRPQPHKNLRRLIKAYSTIQLTHPELKLVLVGKLDAGYKLLKSYVRRQEISGVIFTDFVSEGSLRWLYENAQAYVFPSLSEGFGLPGLEALAHGTPLVSSRATCLPEIYKDAAIYFDPRNTSDMAEKIKIVLEDKELASKLRQNGPKLANQYSWAHTAQQTLEVYKHVLQDS